MNKTQTIEHFINEEEAFSSTNALRSIFDPDNNCINLYSFDLIIATIYYNAIIVGNYTKKLGNYKSHTTSTHTNLLINKLNDLQKSYILWDFDKNKPALH